MVSNENIGHNHNENNTKGFSRSVTAATNENTTKSLAYHNNTVFSDNMYRLYQGGDRWACNNCNERGYKWYMLQHKCKMKRK
jgi:hypothetical protein